MLKLFHHPVALKVACLAGALALLSVPAAEPLAADKKPVAQRSLAKLKPQRVTSFKQLRKLLGRKHVKVSPRNLQTLRDAGVRATPSRLAIIANGVTADAMADAAITASAGAYSQTNVQVEGVDEGDIVKTDGQFIYAIRSGQVRIVKAVPADAMSLLASIPLDEGFNPAELFVEGDRLVVIGNAWTPLGDTAAPTSEGRFGIWAPIGDNQTVAKVYDIANRAQPTVEREIRFSGTFLASRKIGDAVYLVGRSYPMYYTLLASGAPTRRTAMTPESTLPKVSDSAVNDGVSSSLPLSRLYYFPNFVEPDYAIVAGFRLSQPAAPADVKSYLGAGELVYASLQNLFLSAADYPFDSEAIGNRVRTHIYNFALSNGSTEFRNAGEVPGTVLNQFSMDHHNGYFRVATTVNRWEQGEDGVVSRSWSNVYNLDAKMAVIGKLEHLAEGEQIYAARFMGDRAYLVTFRQVDPLFVLDLASPTAPKVLGELKIPGFSNYLHPYDETHLLGIGQDTAVEGDGARVTGMKLALFDVSDVANPKQKHSLTIGEQGTYSDALHDHKAFLFDQERKLLAFPLTVTGTETGSGWPTAVFQGAHVYSVTLESGFAQQAAISHMDKGEVYNWNRYIQRLLTIGDELYSLSESRIQANSLSTFGVTGSLDLPVEGYGYGEDPIDPPILPPPSDLDDVPVSDTICTLDVQRCPDGNTWVSRVGPACEFAACPEAQ